MTSRVPVTRVLALVGLVIFVVFWGWALFFASKEAVNRIGDEAWRTRSEQICADAARQREALADYTVIRGSDADVIRQRADIIDTATDTLDEMLDEIEAQPPTDEKGQNIVPMWITDYRTYVGNRRTYAERLRSTGENLPFYEEEVNGIPISERIATFAGDNVMPACAPPRDLNA